MFHFDFQVVESERRDLKSVSFLCFHILYKYYVIDL